MRLGACLSTVAHAPLIAESSLDYVEENVQTFLAPREDEAAFTARLRTAVTAGRAIAAAAGFLPADLKCTGPAVDDAAIDAWALTAFRRAERTGIRTIVVGSGGSRRLVEGWPRAHGLEQYTAMLRRLAPHAARHGVTLVVEPLNPAECNLLNTVADGATVVRAVAHPAVRLLADLYHMARGGETPADLAPVVPLLHHVHLAECAERTAPGVRGDDFRPWFAVLRAGGYDGPLSLECGFRQPSQQLEPALATVRAHWAEALAPATV